MQLNQKKDSCIQNSKIQRHETKLKLATLKTKDQKKYHKRDIQVQTYELLQHNNQATSPNSYAVLVQLLPPRP